MFHLLNKVKLCFAELVLGWVTKYEPHVLITFFSFFPFSKAILRTAELPSLCNVVSSIYQLFVPYFAIVIFFCIYLHCHINKQKDTSFEFSSILLTVDLSKHLITAWIIQKFIQLANFVTFIVFCFFFGNRVWLNLYEQAILGMRFFLKRDFYNTPVSNSPWPLNKRTDNAFNLYLKKK